MQDGKCDPLGRSGEADREWAMAYKDGVQRVQAAAEAEEGERWTEALTSQEIREARRMWEKGGTYVLEVCMNDTSAEAWEATSGAQTGPVARLVEQTGAIAVCCPRPSRQDTQLRWMILVSAGPRAASLRLLDELRRCIARHGRQTLTRANERYREDRKFEGGFETSATSRWSMLK